MAQEAFANNAATTLTAAVVSTSATTISVASSAAPFPQSGWYRILIDAEVMLVTGGHGTTTLTVVRGVDSSAAATHGNGVAVTQIVTRDSLLTLRGGGLGLLVAASNAPDVVKNRADYVCDGTDDDVEVQAAIDAGSTLGVQVNLSRGNFVGGKLVGKNGTKLIGEGYEVTYYTLKNAANTCLFQNYVSSDGVEANGQSIEIRDLTLDGNVANQTNFNTTCNGITSSNGATTTLASATGWPTSGYAILDRFNTSMEVVKFTRSGTTLTTTSRGEAVTPAQSHSNGAAIEVYTPIIQLEQNPAWSQATNDHDYDSNFRMTGCYLWRGRSDAFFATGRGVHRMTDCTISHMDGRGIVPTADSTFVNLNVGHCGMGGCTVITSTRWIGVSSFYNGINNQGGVVGSKYRSGYRITGTQGPMVMTGCMAQDNYGSGFFYDGAQHSTASSCTADSNGKEWNGTGNATYAGYEFEGASNNILEACEAQERREFGTTLRPQRYAIKIMNTSTLNRISVMHSASDAGDPSGPGLVDRPIHPSSNSVSNNDIRVNNYWGHQQIAWTSNAITPRVYDGQLVETVTLGTGTTTYTINAPDTLSPGHEGCRMIVTITRAASGTPTLAWNAVYHFAAGATTDGTIGATASGSSTWEFINYDGTNWRCISAMKNAV